MGLSTAAGEGANGPTDRADLLLPLAKIEKAKVRNGRLVWLTDLTPTHVEQTPYFDRLMPYQIDKSLTGGKLQLPEGAMTKGIAVHSRCVLTYDLDGAFEKFKVRVGFQQPEGKLGRAALRILGDGKVLWENADLKGQDKSVPLDLKLTGLQKLTLEADYGQDQDVADRIIWGEPQLLRAPSQKPETQPSATSPAK